MVLCPGFTSFGFNDLRALSLGLFARAMFFYLFVYGAWFFRAWTSLLFYLVPDLRGFGLQFFYNAWFFFLVASRPSSPAHGSSFITHQPHRGRVAGCFIASAPSDSNKLSRMALVSTSSSARIHHPPTSPRMGGRMFSAAARSGTSKASAPARQVRQQGKCASKASAPAMQVRRQGKCASKASAPARQVHQQGKFTSKASSPARQVHQQGKFTSKASSPAWQEGASDRRGEDVKGCLRRGRLSASWRGCKGTLCDTGG